MRYSWSTLLLLLLVCTSASTTIQTGYAADSNFIPTEKDASDYFDLVREAQQKGNAAEALTYLLILLDRAELSSSLLQTKPGYYQPVSRFVPHYILSQKPIRKFYKIRYDSTAKKQLDAARRSQDAKAIWHLANRYFASSYSQKAALQAGDLFMEQGDFDAATTCFLSALNKDYDNQALQTEASARLVMLYNYRKDWQALEHLNRSLPPEALSSTVSIQGKKQPLSKWIHANRQNGQSSTLLKTQFMDWPTFDGNHQRNKISLLDFRLGDLVWHANLKHQSSQDNYDLIQPASSKDIIVYQDHSCLVRIEGAGIRVEAGMLLVTQTPRVHAEIAALLQQLQTLD